MVMLSRFMNLFLLINYSLLTEYIPSFLDKKQSSIQSSAAKKKTPTNKSATQVENKTKSYYSDTTIFNKIKDKERKRQSRRRRSQETIEFERTKDRERKRKSRKRRSSETIMQEREQDQQQKRDAEMLDTLKV